MELKVQVEKSSSIQRKVTVRVPAQTVALRFERGVMEVQKTANLKGFRPGHAPVSMIRQFYGDDIRHRLFHNLIDESFNQAAREQNLRVVGRPSIETPEHITGAGEHDHSLKEGQDLVYTATVEVLPEIEPKGYEGIALTRESADVKKADVEAVVARFQDSRSKMVDTEPGHKIKKGDHADITFEGGLVTESGIEKKQGMSGSRMLEVGSDTLIPGFEDELVGMSVGTEKTFRIRFPKDFFEKDLADKESEFFVKVNSIKKKELPALDDALAKDLGYQDLKDMESKVKAQLEQEKAAQVDGKLRQDLVAALIEKNSIEVPSALVQSQVRALAQDVGENLQRQGFSNEMIQETLVQETTNLKQRAESQVRASLILEAIAKKESIVATTEEMNREVSQMAASMKVDEARVREFYEKDAGRKDDLEFRIRQEKVLTHLVSKAKVKQAK
jgi:trigger factor